MTRLATRGSFLTPADESLIRSQVAKAGVLAARRGADFHDQTWTASVDIAHAQQEGAEQAFKNQVDMLMQVPRVQAAFRKMDADGDGVMTSEEISNGIVVCMEEMGVSATPKQLEKLLRKLDEDHDGVFDGNLSLAKLCTILVGRHDEMMAAKAEADMLQQAFGTIFEVDADGYVSEAELRHFFCMQNRVQLFGVDEDAFDLLLEELGAPHPDGSGSQRVHIDDLMHHEAFQLLSDDDR